MISWSRRVFASITALVIGGMIAACEPSGPASVCDPKPNGLGFVNYDGVESDSTAFVLDTLEATFNDTIEATNRVVSLVGEFYFFEESGGGTLSAILFKDSVTKAQVSFVIKAARGSGCNAKRDFRTYAIIWTNVIDSLGYTQVQILE